MDNVIFAGTKTRRVEWPTPHYLVTLLSGLSGHELHQPIAREQPVQLGRLCAPYPTANKLTNFSRRVGDPVERNGDTHVKLGPRSPTWWDEEVAALQRYRIVELTFHRRPASSYTV